MSNSSDYFPASWGTGLKAMTLFGILILLGVMGAGLLSGPRQSIYWALAMIWLPLAILLISALFTVRGYQLRGSFLLVRRLGWYTRIDLTDLSSSQYDPQAMASSIRTFGNGGLFGFSGKYWNRELGSYKVYATNPENAVVLRLGKKVLVVTPDNPNDFVAALQRCL